MEIPLFSIHEYQIIVIRTFSYIALYNLKSTVILIYKYVYIILPYVIQALFCSNNTLIISYENANM